MKRFRFLMLICILFAAGCSSSRETSGAADRASWLSSMIRIADPVLRHAAAGTLKEAMPYESPDSLGKRRDFACLEALGRTLCGIAPWLELDGESDPRQAEYRLLARRALSRAVDPSDAGYLTFDRGRQPLVDAAYLAEGVLRAKRQLWTELDAAARANLTDALKRTRTIRPGETNWLLFASMVEAALLELTGSCDTARMRYGTDRFLNDFYKGDGMYGDGKFFHMDYYNSYVIHPMLLDVLTIMERHGLADSCTLATERRRHTRYAAILERMVAPDGSYPVLGRSITACRFGVFHALGQSALLHSLPDEVLPPQVRCAMTAVLRRQLECPDNFDSEGWLRVGFVGGRQGSMAERYVNTGSLYHCLTFFLPLGLPASDPFWSGAPVPWTNLKAWSGEPLPGDHALKDA